jgi:hypothetical protein
MDRFLKIQNFQVCKDAFAKWMDKTYTFSVAGNNLQTAADQMLFETMRQVKSEYADDDAISVKDLNDISLERLVDAFVAQHKIHAPPQLIARDVGAFGNRPTGTPLVLANPQATTNRDYLSVDHQFDLLMANRKVEQQGGPQQAPQAPTTYEPEKPIPNDLFEKLLQDRGRTLETEIDVRGAPPAFPENPQAFFTSPAMPSGHGHVHDTAYSSVAELETANAPPPATDISNTIQPLTARTLSTRYVTINGYDRDWLMQHRRCAFSIDFGGFAHKYKNVSSIAFTRLIVPNEIIEARSLYNMPKFVHHHDQKLAYPYLFLQVDEISDVCDGASQQAQKSFTQFIYDTSYKCPNGRGYVVMTPAQNETKTFYPQTLSAIQRLTFQITKPNGTLFNNNRDDYNITKIEYEIYNTLYIKIVTDKYFDKNEFYIGDSIQMTNYSMYMPPAAASPPSASDYAAMASFVNRPEGHEIVQLGDANENGFYRSFYVLGPCHLDQCAGKLVIEKNLVDTLKLYNAATGSLHPTAGSIINVSLQLVISMTVGLDVADKSILMSRPI